MTISDVEKVTTDILRQPCPYMVPPYSYIGGHSFCPCFCKALRAAYITGFNDAKAGREQTLGVSEQKEEPHAPQGT